MAVAHWLQNTLLRAGHAAAAQLELPREVGTAEAWLRAARALDMAETRIAEDVAKRFHLGVADTGHTSAGVEKLVPESVVRRFLVLPLRENEREIVVATANPTDLDAEQALAFASGRNVLFEIAPPAVITAAIEAHYPPEREVRSLLERVDTRPAESLRIVDELAGAAKKAHGGESAAVAKLINLILRAAFDRRASALEITQAAGSGAVNFLVDGVWSRFMQLPVPSMNHVINRLRLLGNVGIANRGWSHDGGARIRMEGRTYDLRVRATAESGVQHATVRIYDQQFSPSLEEAGLSESAEQAVRSLLRGSGLVLIAAPPGSGRKTLLNAMLRDVTRAGRTAISVEDATRADLPGVVQQHADRGRTAEVVDDAGPSDVLAISRVEDGPTAHAALRAAGDRLVIISIPAATALDAIRHLVALGVPADGLAGVLRGMLAVRLVRRLCDACARPGDGGNQERQPVGCTACDRVGFRGVVPLAGVTIFDDGMATALRASAWVRLAERLGEAHALETDAGLHVEAGRTTTSEIERVLGPAPDSAPSAAAEPVVLVADDDPMIVALARTILESDGVRVLEATDGHEALERIAERHDVGLLIVDLDMPRLDGHQVVDRLKRDVRTAGLPIVVLTASTNPDDEARALERGADDYLRKPIDPPRFLARVRAVMRRTRG
jgi:type II secretory ATPase GspE/PulE/Tfp pilus assembly ATPase PilB-like protein/ActR/RegA family two-component response regulator